MWLRKEKEKKKKLRSLIRFHSANKIDNYSRAGRRGKKKKTVKKKKSKSKRIYRTCQSIRIIHVFLESTAVRVLSLTGSHSPPDLPRMHSNTVLISGPAVGVAEVLIWSYSCVFLPPMPMANRNSALFGFFFFFFLVGALSVLIYIP